MSTDSTTIATAHQHPFNVSAFRQNITAIDAEVKSYLTYCLERNIKVPRNRTIWVNKKKGFFLPQQNSLADINALLSAIRWYTPANLDDYKNDRVDYTTLGYACCFFIDADVAPIEVTSVDGTKKQAPDYSRCVSSIELVITPRPGVQVYNFKNCKTRPVEKRDVKVFTGVDPVPTHEPRRYERSSGRGRGRGGGGRRQYNGDGDYHRRNDNDGGYRRRQYHDTETASETTVTEPTPHYGGHGGRGRSVWDGRGGRGRY
jgi:hypothetical protein